MPKVPSSALLDRRGAGTIHLSHGLFHSATTEQLWSLLPAASITVVCLAPFPLSIHLQVLHLYIHQREPGTLSFHVEPRLNHVHIATKQQFVMSRANTFGSQRVGTGFGNPAESSKPKAVVEEYSTYFISWPKLKAWLDRKFPRDPRKPYEQQVSRSNSSSTPCFQATKSLRFRCTNRITSSSFRGV